MTFVTVPHYKIDANVCPFQGRLCDAPVSAVTYSVSISADFEPEWNPNDGRQTVDGKHMDLLDNLPLALADFIRAGTGSSPYEHALVWSLVAVICVLVVIAVA
jgi:hypothetical protein